MRFCRTCGFRLGEGSAEYTETVRFGNQPPAASQRTAAADAANVPFGASDWGAMSAPGARGQPVKGVTSPVGLGLKKRRRKGPHWIVWVLFAALIVSVAGGSLIKPLRVKLGSTASTASAPQSEFGVNGFKSVDNGAMIDAVSPPGGPADTAGLLGGDVITVFDGQPIKNESDIKRALAATPVGKTVDVTYLRDGETKTAKMTTMDGDALERLTDALEDRPGGKGYIGEGFDLDRVVVSGMNIYGVQLNDVRKNRPGYTSGLRTGDIVIEFDGLPMRTRREFELRIERAIPDSTVKTVVIRNGERVEIPIKIGVDD